MNDYDTTSANLKEPAVSLYALALETPLGLMLGIANERALCFLNFVPENEVELKVQQFAAQRNMSLNTNKQVGPLVILKKELVAYFKGKLQSFQTLCHAQGTPFQQCAWDALRQIPFGQTRSYKAQAISLGNPSACRAVGGANNANPIAIVIPCHRVINADGKLGGYAGGLEKKIWLLEHEKKYKNR